MHIHHLALRVRDFEKSLHFYQTLTELKIHTQFSANGGSIALSAERQRRNPAGADRYAGGRDRQGVRYVPLLRYGGYRQRT